MKNDLCINYSVIIALCKMLVYVKPYVIRVITQTDKYNTKKCKMAGEVNLHPLLLPDAIIVFLPK